MLGFCLPDLIQAAARLLAGRLLPAAPAPLQAGNLTSNRKEAAQLLLAQYDGLLTFLKSHGCLLNAVKPELLLDIEEFRWEQWGVRPPRSVAPCRWATQL